MTNKIVNGDEIDSDAYWEGIVSGISNSTTTDNLLSYQYDSDAEELNLTIDQSKIQTTLTTTISSNHTTSGEDVIYVSGDIALVFTLSRYSDGDYPETTWDSDWTALKGIFLDRNGMYVIGYNGSNYEKVTFDNFMDFSSVSTTETLSIDDSDYENTAWRTFNDGFDLIFLDTSNGNLYHYKLSAAYDFENYSQEASVDAASQLGEDSSNMSGNARPEFNSDGTILWLPMNGSSLNNNLYEVPLNTAYDITSADWNNAVGININSSFPYGAEVYDDKKLLVWETGNPLKIMEFDTEGTMTDGLTKIEDKALYYGDGEYDTTSLRGYHTTPSDARLATFSYNKNIVGSWNIQEPGLNEVVLSYDDNNKGKEIKIVDTSGTASNVLSVTASSAEIRGGESNLTKDYQTKVYISDGTNWYVRGSE